MNPDRMRFIDKWVGVPLSFVFSIFTLLYDLLFASKKKSKQYLKKVLFIELSEMGSALIVDPAMRYLKEEAGTEIYFAIFKSNAKSLKILNTVKDENIFKMRSENLFVLAIDVFRYIFWCRSKGITTSIDLELFSRFTALLSGLSFAKQRIGFGSLHDEGLYRGSIINKPVRYNAHVHISVNFKSLINAAIGGFEGPYPTKSAYFEDIKLQTVTVPEQEKEVVRDKIKSVFPDYSDQLLVLLNANASDLLPQRRWLPERFAEIAQRISDKYEGVLILATGSPNEQEYVQNVVDIANRPNFVNTAGLFEFEELIPLYDISLAMLTNDSGPGHFSSVTPLKVYVIFGPETPALYGPMGENSESIYLGLPCSPCVSAANHRKTTCETRPCITGISVDMVWERMDKFLSEKLKVETA